MQVRNDNVEHYAEALIAIAKANNSLREIELELVDLLEFMHNNEPLQRFLNSATIEQKGKRSAMDEILEGHTNPLLIDFICMLITANSLPMLKDIFESFSEKALKEHKQVSGEIHSATNLSDFQVEEIENEIGRILDKKLNLQPRIVPGILGGILVKVGDFIVDGTIDRQLSEAKKQLLA
jgi:F-type H+-transporting ATPase subunit delta